VFLKVFFCLLGFLGFKNPAAGESIAVDMLLLRRLMAVVDRTALPALGIAQPLVGGGPARHSRSHSLR
jgi:hypothetical protein